MNVAGFEDFDSLTSRTSLRVLDDAIESSDRGRITQTHGTGT